MNEKIKESITIFLKSLENSDQNFQFYPVIDGLTEWGKRVELGFSCYALKIYYILGEWDKLDSKNQLNWIKYINSFQVKNHEIENAYIDTVFKEYFYTFNLKKDLKNITKTTLTKLNLKKFETRKQILFKNYIAETKQAIATLAQVGHDSKYLFNNFPKDEFSINDYLNKFDWNKPWNAGAQFASLCVFSASRFKSDNNKEIKNILESFITKKVNLENGFYCEKSTTSSVELINGAMKVISGLEWLETPIHYPDKIIEFCLNNKPNQEGCDLVDIVYVLSKCSQQSLYKKNEIKLYFEEIKKIIFKNYKEKHGGFSYFQNKSQTHYYGIPISHGLDTADIHGTLLLLWALSLIDNFETENNSDLKDLRV